MGLHIMPGTNNGAVLDLLSTLARAGRPVAGVTLVRMGWGSELKAADIKAVSPQTKILYRWYTSEWDHRSVDWGKSDLTADGAKWMTDYYNQFLANDPDARLAEYHQIINEPTASQSTPSFWTGALNVAEPLGLRLVPGCFAVGYPALPNEPGQMWTAFYPILRRAKILMLHQYISADATPGTWDNDWLILRHKRLYAQFPADLKNLPLIFGEFGSGYAHKTDANTLFTGIRLADSDMKPDPVVSANLWTFGGAGAWGDSDMTDKIPQLKSYLLGF